MKVHAGEPNARGRRYAIAVSRFNGIVTSKLLDGAVAAFRRQGVSDDDLEVAWTPGAFELPLAALRLARSGQFDAVVCLGAVIRGETPHFDHVAGQTASGVQRVALETGVPCIFGVLTTDDLDQALERAGGSAGNKGYEAAEAALLAADAVTHLTDGDAEA